MRTRNAWWILPRGWFALNGRIERVTAKVFLLTPSDLEVLGITSSDDMPQAFDDEGLVPFDQG